MRKVAIIYSSYDGVINSYCGVGTVTQAFIKSFASVRNFYLQCNIDLQLHLVTPALVPESLGYDDNIMKFSRDYSRSTMGNVHFITNDSDGQVPYGDCHNWTAVSNTCATKILEIASNYEQSIAYCVDTPFMHAPRLAEQQRRAFVVENIKYVIVLHSDALTHEPVNPSIDRLSWEASALKMSIGDPNIYIASTSRFLERHILKEYDIPEDKFVSFQTGVYPPSSRYASVDKDDVIKALSKYQIPLDRDLIFSVGRAVPYKGFDLLIKAIAQLKKKPHLVFIASPYKSENSCIEEIKKLLVETEISATSIYKLDFNLPKMICQWEKTKIVAQLSTYEPFGLVPEEVRLWAENQGPVILASEKDGYKEQITDGIDGFLVDIEQPEKIGNKIDYILNLSAKELDKVRMLGYKRAIQNYDYRISVFSSLNQMLFNGGLEVEEFKRTI